MTADTCSCPPGMPDDERYPIPTSVQNNIQRRAVATDRPMPCGDGVGGGQTCGTYPARLYPRGWRCSRCARAAGLQVPDDESSR